MPFQKSVQKLVDLLKSDPNLRSAVEISIQTAALKEIATLSQFYNYLNSILTHIPTEKELMPSVRKFYYVLSKSPRNVLKASEKFNVWIYEFVNARGEYMNSTESTETLDSFTSNPKYKINDYIKPQGGWLNYNQFLARHIKPGRRPVADRCNDNVIVCPADSTCMGQYDVQDDSTILVKGITYSIAQLLQGSANKNKFKGGVFTHSFLEVTNYHRFHLPVSGKVVEVINTPATTWTNNEKKPDGSVENTDDVGFQFTHTRACVIIRSPVGLVAVIPVGMGHISSVNITAEEGLNFVKGEELGYFAFGGSDIIMLFQKDKVKLSPIKKKDYKMGEKIGVASHA